MKLNRLKCSKGSSEVKDLTAKTWRKTFKAKNKFAPQKLQVVMIINYFFAFAKPHYKHFSVAPNQVIFYYI